jgi:drug/metabolite transporter (DMT)-like permease
MPFDWGAVMARRARYRPNRESFGEFLLSGQVRRPVKQIAKVIAAEAAATDGTSIAGDYEARSGPTVTVAGNPRGVVTCVAGALCSGFFLTFSGRILSRKMDAVQLNFLAAPVSLACLLPFVLARELADFRLFATANAAATAAVLCLTSAVAVAYGLVHMLMVRYTSSVGVTVVGAVKIMGLMGLSVVVLGEASQLTLKMAGGMSVAGAGFLLYTWSKLKAMRQQSAGGPAGGAQAPLLAK